MTTAEDDLGLALSRRHAAGAESARGLLFTVLGEFVLPGGGSAWTSTFIDAFGRLGVEHKTVRQALMRTSGDGWLSAERVGRRTCWHLTASAVELLTEGTERIYGFTGVQQDWDGRWLLVLARIPERDRTVRHLLRTRFTRAGFGSAAAAAWVTTHADRRTEAERILREAGVLHNALVLDGEIVAGQRLAEMVRLAWDLDSIDTAYIDFIAEFRPRLVADPLVRLIELVHAWRRFPWIDPALPRTLLTRGWKGERAAGLFAQRHRQLSAAARAEWVRLEGADGG